MAAGAQQAARRAFVTVLLALAAAYGVAVAANRDSPDGEKNSTTFPGLLTVGGEERERGETAGGKAEREN